MSLIWFFVLTAFAVILSGIGWATNRALSRKKRLRRYQKFVLAGLLPLVIYFFLSIPYVKPPYINEVSSNKKTSFPQNLPLDKETEKYFYDQHLRIENLEREVVDLRNDLHQTHRH